MSGLKLPEGFTWGQRATLTVAPNSSSTRAQVMSIKHPFPETWRWLLWAQVDESDPARAIALEWELFTGVGQTTADLSQGNAGFQRFVWNAGTSRRDPKWSTRYRSPRIDDTNLSSAEEGELIVGQSLVLSAVISQSASPIETSVTIVSLFAPNVNARAPQAKGPGGDRPRKYVPSFDDGPDGPDFY